MRENKSYKFEFISDKERCIISFKANFSKKIVSELLYCLRNDPINILPGSFKIFFRLNNITYFDFISSIENINNERNYKFFNYIKDSKSADFLDGYIGEVDHYYLVFLNTFKDKESYYEEQCIIKRVDKFYDIIMHETITYYHEDKSIISFLYTYQTDINCSYKLKETIFDRDDKIIRNSIDQELWFVALATIYDVILNMVSLKESEKKYDYLLSYVQNIVI